MANTEDSRQEPSIGVAREQPVAAQVRPTRQDNAVVLTDIDIPFGRVVLIMVKWTLAAIPAAILATIVVYGLILLFSLLAGALLGIR